jgi:LPS export ABC transporter protein LptC
LRQWPSRPWQKTYAAILLLGGSFGCTAEETTQAEPHEGEQPVQTTREFTTTQSDSGRRVFVFNAKVARVYEDDVTRAEVVRVDFYRDGEKVSVLTSDQAVLRKGGQLTAIGNVVVVALEDSSVLRTERLYWDRVEKKIRTDVPFVLTEKNGDELHGQSLVTDPDLELLEVVDPDIRLPDVDVHER